MMKMLYECLAMNFSSQDTANQPTMKLTTVAVMVAGQPTPPLAVEMLSYSLTVCSTDAASRAGMDRKNDSFVTVTRSRSRSRPADMVAPERDTPGIRDRHCTMPMMRVSFQVTSSSWRTWVAAWSANHMAPDQMIR